MKNVDSYSSFLLNESKREAIVKTETSTEISAKLEKLLREAAKLNEEVEAEREKFEESIKIKELQLKSKYNTIIESMEKLGTSMIKYKKILATIETSKGKITYPYAKLWEFAMDQASLNQKKILLEYKELNKKINPDKVKLEIKRVDESLSQMLTSIWSFLQNKAASLMKSFQDFSDSIEILEVAVKSVK